MTEAEQDADRIGKIERCATASQVRDLIAGMAYAAEAGAQPYTANQKAAAAKRLAALERSRR